MPRTKKTAYLEEFKNHIYFDIFPENNPYSDLLNNLSYHTHSMKMIVKKVRRFYDKRDKRKPYKPQNDYVRMVVDDDMVGHLLGHAASDLMKMGYVTKISHSQLTKYGITETGLELRKKCSDLTPNNLL